MEHLYIPITYRLYILLITLANIEIWSRGFNKSYSTSSQSNPVYSHSSKNNFIPRKQKQEKLLLLLDNQIRHIFLNKNSIGQRKQTRLLPFIDDLVLWIIPSLVVGARNFDGLCLRRLHRSLTDTVTDSLQVSLSIGNVANEVKWGTERVKVMKR